MAIESYNTLNSVILEVDDMVEYALGANVDSINFCDFVDPEIITKVHEYYTSQGYNITTFESYPIRNNTLLDMTISWERSGKEC